MAVGESDPSAMDQIVEAYHQTTAVGQEAGRVALVTPEIAQGLIDRLTLDEKDRQHRLHMQYGSRIISEETGLPIIPMDSRDELEMRAVDRVDLIADGSLVL